MKKILTPIAFAAAAIFGMYACLFSSGSGGGGANGAPLLQGSAEVVSITPPTASAPGKLVVRTIYSHCSGAGDELVTDTSIDTSFYYIASGKLILWYYGGDCVAGALSGTSTTIIGTWTATNTKLDDYTGERVLVPSAYRDASCPSTLPPDSSSAVGYFDIYNVTATYTVSSSKIETQLNGDFCYARDSYGDSSTYTPYGGQKLKVTNVSCSSVELTDTTNQKKLNFTVKLQNGVMIYSTASGGKTCTLAESSFVYGGTPSCTPSWAASESTYTSCVNSLGILPTGVLLKAATSAPVNEQEHQHPWWKRK